MQFLNIKLYENPGEAPIYRPPEYENIKLLKANIVKKGMTEGSPTIDLILEDDKGQKYMSLISGNLIIMLGKMTNAIKNKKEDE